VPRSLAPLRPYGQASKPTRAHVAAHVRGGRRGARRKSNLILWFSLAAVVVAGSVFIFNGFFLTSRLLAGCRWGGVNI
jgi:hypothetical protein